MQKLVNNLKVLMLILLVNHVELQVTTDLTLTGVPVEVSKCTEYKKQLFEETQTYIPLIYGAKEISTTVDRCKQYAPFIVGGSPASPKEFPHMARLGYAERRKRTAWFCGGTLISDRFVLTAAHCFYAPDGVVNIVRLGDLDYSSSTDDADPEDFEVQRTIPHEEYFETSIYNDIGLIELKRSVVFNLYKHPACLPISSGDDYNQVLAIGWGSVRFAGAASETLLKVSLDRFSYNYCSRIAKEAGSDKLPFGLSEQMQLCAGSNASKDACNGDSGGPLLAYHNDYPCMYFVVGITSAGIGGCGTPTVPGIYTRVYNYLNWIRNYVWR